MVVHTGATSIRRISRYSIPFPGGHWGGQYIIGLFLNQFPKRLSASFGMLVENLEVGGQFEQKSKRRRRETDSKKQEIIRV